MVGLDEVLDELLKFFGFEAKEFDGVKAHFLCEGVGDFVFLDETLDL